MKKVITYAAVCCLLAGMGLSARAEEYIEPIYSASQSVDNATKFCETVGWQPQGEKEVKEAKSDHGNNKVWRVGADSYRIDVDETTGAVHHAMNNKAFDVKIKRKVGITAEIANALAVKYLQAAGLSLDNAKLSSSQIANYTTDPGNAVWEVRFNRVFNGYPFYKSDFILVTLDIADGSLTSMGYNFDSLDPASTQVLVSESDAINNAIDYMATKGVDAGAVLSADLVIVQPNRYWSPETAATELTGGNISRLAWQIRFDAPWKKTEVWVDAENGIALGGVRSMSIPIPALSQTKIEYIPTGVSGAAQSGFVVGNDLKKSLVSELFGLRRADCSSTSFCAMVKAQSGSDTYTFGYSSIDHLLVLVERDCQGMISKEQMAWSTSETLEKLFEQLTKQ